jgi:hypothetical protein
MKILGPMRRLMEVEVRRRNVGMSQMVEPKATA